MTLTPSILEILFSYCLHLYSASIQIYVITVNVFHFSGFNNLFLGISILTSSLSQSLSYILLSFIRISFTLSFIFVDIFKIYTLQTQTLRTSTDKDIICTCIFNTNIWNVVSPCLHAINQIHSLFKDIYHQILIYPSVTCPQERI